MKIIMHLLSASKRCFLPTIRYIYIYISRSDLDCVKSMALIHWMDSLCKIVAQRRWRAIEITFARIHGRFSRTQQSRWWWKQLNFARKRSKLIGNKNDGERIDGPFLFRFLGRAAHFSRSQWLPVILNGFEKNRYPIKDPL